AQARGGMAAAAAVLRRTVAPTSETAPRSARGPAGAPARLHGRALAVGAAGGSLQAGAFDAAAGLLNIAAAGPLDELQQARVGLLRGQIAFASSMGSAAPALLVRAPGQREPLDAALARQTYLDAWNAAMYAG